MPFTPLATNEQTLLSIYPNEIHKFWQTGVFDTFQGVDNIRINFACFIDKGRKKNLIIVPGRSESYIKYQELSYEFTHQGYNVFIIDHRGQGLSERMLDNPHKGFVNDFNDYASDLYTFITQYVQPASKNPLYLLAHSMGSAIAALYLATYPNTIKAAILSSPMIAINTGMLPKPIAHGLINTVDLVEKHIIKQNSYFPGQKDHRFKNFTENKLSQSTIRYQIFKNLYQENSQVHLGGVTVQWLKQAHTIKQKLLDNSHCFNLPIRILQAGDDSVVDNQAQNEFCSALHKHQPNLCPDTKPVYIAGAWHELLFEQDKYREKAIIECLTWFELHK